MPKVRPPLLPMPPTFTMSGRSIQASVAPESGIATPEESRASSSMIPPAPADHHPPGVTSAAALLLHVEVESVAAEPVEPRDRGEGLNRQVLEFGPRGVEEDDVRGVGRVGGLEGAVARQVGG